VTTPADVIAEARSWVGVPFRHQGRSRHGIDCVGLPIVVGQVLGIFPAKFEIANYGRTPTGELEQRIISHCEPARFARAGGLVVIAWTTKAAHVAICTGDTLIHAYERIGKVVEHGYRGRWVRMTHSTWQLPGVMYGQ
jgi:cell wall-associated NlpC family hydrolase